VTLATTSEYLNVLSGTATPGTIADGGQVVAVFTVEAAASIPDGTAATFSIDAEAGLYATDCEFEETLDVIIEDSETGVLDGFNWQMDGDADWFVTTQSPYEGDYCMESGNIADGEVTTLKTVMNVLEVGDIQFSFRTSTEASYDFLIFNINGSVMGQWSGDNDWTVVSYPVNPGSVTFRWRYDKDNIVSNGEDAAWVDDIIFPPYEQSVTVVENENNPWDVMIFPNPAADQSTLIVSLTSASEVGVTITGTHGELVYQMPARMLAMGDNNLQLPVQQLAAGVYMVQVKSDFGTQTTKLIVK
jgi:Secretion system C-terminal sorting domain